MSDLATLAVELSTREISPSSIGDHINLLLKITDSYLFSKPNNDNLIVESTQLWSYLKQILQFALRDPIFGEPPKPYKLIHTAIYAFIGLYKSLFNSFTIAKTLNDKLIWDQLNLIKDQLISKWPTSFPLPFTNSETQIFQSQSVMEALTKLVFQVILSQSDELIPNNHSYINSNLLQSQGNGLLDKLISLLADDLLLPPTLFSTINSSLVSLFRSRQTLVTQRFLNITLAYESQFKSNPKFLLDDDNKKIQIRLIKRFNDRMNKISMALLFNRGLLNSGPQLPYKQRFEKKLKYMSDRDSTFKQQKISITSDKWDEGEDIDDPELTQKLKRRKLDTKDVLFNESKTPLENDWASIYTLIRSHDNLTQFDMSSIEPHYLASMVLLGLAKVDTKTLVKGLDIVQDRYKWVSKPVEKEIPKTEVTPEIKSDDEYDPSAGTTVTATPAAVVIKTEPVKQQAPPIDDSFVLPPPPKLEGIQEGDIIKSVIDDMISALPQTISSMPTVGNQESQSKLQNKLIITTNSQFSPETQLVILIRLATRGLNESHSKYIRLSLLEYFKQDWKSRMNGLLWWLNEEWFSHYKLNVKSEQENDDEVPYLHYLNLFMDHLISFIEMSDRAIFIRFLSELPLVPLPILSKVKAICLDPMRMKLGFQSLLFLMMFRPPIISDAKIILNEIKDHATTTGNETVLKESTNLLNKFI